MEPKEIALRLIERNEAISRDKAEKLLRKLERDTRNIIALWGYVTWAKQNNLLLGGPNIEEAFDLSDKPYGKGSPYLSLNIWDVIDLLNGRTFNKYVRENLVMSISIKEILFCHKGNILL